MLKIKLARIENVILMKILEMDERLRHIDMPIYHCPTIDDSYFSNIEIASFMTPCIKKLDNNIQVYIGGQSKDQDNKLSAYEFETNEMAISFINELTFAIKNINDELLREGNDKNEFDFKINEIHEIY